MPQNQHGYCLEEHLILSYFDAQVSINILATKTDKRLTKVASSVRITRSHNLRQNNGSSYTYQSKF